MQCLRYLEILLEISCEIIINTKFLHTSFFTIFVFFSNTVIMNIMKISWIFHSVYGYTTSWTVSFTEISKFQLTIAYNLILVFSSNRSATPSTFCCPGVRKSHFIFRWSHPTSITDYFQDLPMLFLG